jgi:hypothetical protein
MKKEFKSVRGLLQDKNRWTKGALAVNASGKVVSSSSETAVKFCLVGAVSRIYPSEKNFLKRADVFKRLLAALKSFKYCYPTIVQFNDAHLTTHDEVLKLIRKARV